MKFKCDSLTNSVSKASVPESNHDNTYFFFRISIYPPALYSSGFLGTVTKAVIEAGPTTIRTSQRLTLNKSTRTLWLSHPTGHSPGRSLCPLPAPILDVKYCGVLVLIVLLIQWGHLHTLSRGGDDVVLAGLL